MDEFNLDKNRSNTCNEPDDETSDDVVPPIGPSIQLRAEPQPNVILTKSLRRRLPSLAQACDRHGVSDRAAAAIASAVLQDFCVISDTNLSNVVDQNKIRPERLRKRNELQDLTKFDDLRGLFVDG